MPVDVTDAFVELLAGNHGPSPEGPNIRRRTSYGIAASLDGDRLDVTLTFLRGEHYCCMEWGCHMGLHDGLRWARLRQALGARGIVPPDRLKLQLTGVVEEGAIFFDPFRPDPEHGGWYAFRAVTAARYEASSVEASADSTAEPDTA